jgi:hypothetical protein
LLIAGKPDDPYFSHKAMAIQRSTAIRERWELLNPNKSPKKDLKLLKLFL